jgi:hypothetical protein
LEDKQRYEVVGVVSSHKNVLAIKPESLRQDADAIVHVHHPSVSDDSKFKTRPARASFSACYLSFGPKNEVSNSNNIIPVPAFDDWPTTNTSASASEEGAFLKEKFKWSSPANDATYVSGVENRMSVTPNEPDFVLMYV